MSYHFVSNISSLQIKSTQTERLFSMRIEKNQIVKLTDLNGLLATVEITNLNKKEALIDYKIIKEEFISESNFWDLAKQNLFHATLDKLYMEKLFEILPHTGFKNIYFFEADFSQSQNLNLERLNKILIRSLEQSQSLYQPKIKFIQKQDQNQLASLLEQFKPSFLDCQTDSNSSLSLKTNSVDSFLVGPEGGWSQRETSLFNQLELGRINLGSIIYPAWLASNKL